MKLWLMQKWNFWVLWIEIRIWGWQMRREVNRMLKLTPVEAGPLLTKARWQASRLSDVQFRETMLDLLADVDRRIKTRTFLLNGRIC